MPNDLSNATWSQTDANNNAASPAGAPEGMASSGVNDTMRAQAGAMKRWHDNITPTVTSGGAANVQTLTYSVANAALVAGDTFSFIAGFTTTASATLNVNGLGAITIKKALTTGLSALVAGEIVAGQIVDVAYDGASFILKSPWQEIGAWTPTLVGSTGGVPTSYTTQQGRYVRTGRLIQVRSSITINVLGGALTGFAQIGGLPYAVSATAPSGGMAVALMSSITLDAGYTQLLARATNGTSVIRLREGGSNTAGSDLPVANLASGCTIGVSGEYEID